MDTRSLTMLVYSRDDNREDETVDTKDLRTPEAQELADKIKGLEKELTIVKDRVTILERSRHLQLRGRNKREKDNTENA